MNNYKISQTIRTEFIKVGYLHQLHNYRCNCYWKKKVSKQICDTFRCAFVKEKKYVEKQ